MLKKISVLTLAILLLFTIVYTPKNMASANAGLAWGPVFVGNLKFYMTNVHKGYAGPKFPNHYHVNFHVDKKSGYKYTPVANYHIVKYKKGSKHCVYIWEGKRKKTIMDTCTSSWTSTAQKAASAIKSFTKTLLSYANWIATIVIWGVITFVIINLIVGAGIVVALDTKSTKIIKYDNDNNLSLPDDYDPKDYITEPQPTEVTIGVDIYDIQLDDDGNEMLNNTSYIPVLPTVEVVP